MPDMARPQPPALTGGRLGDLGLIEKPAQYRFLIYASGRDRMRDLVGTEVVERYLVRAWQAE